jgi:hypothetical protein
MGNASLKDFAKRQAQWDAFHDWETRQDAAPLPMEQRVAWYSSAFDFTYRALAQHPKDIQKKVELIRRVRHMLSYLH